MTRPPTPGDPICAPATAPGSGAIGIVRVSGDGAIDRVSARFRASDRTPLTEAPSHTVHHGHMVAACGTPIDEVLVIVMRAPRSYTTEDVVEVQCHGGGAAVSAVMSALTADGCRMAEPGEFTRRAFLGGRIDLTQAEAVMEVIEARTELHQRLAQRQLDGALSEQINGVTDALRDLCAHMEAAIDFPEDDLEDEVPQATIARLQRAQVDLEAIVRGARTGDLVRDGVRLAIVGRPNVGKSSLLNRMLGYDRAIVNQQPGTTRDVLEAELNIEGVRFIVQDTAGIRDTTDPVEAEGVSRSHQAMAGADLTLVVLDGSAPLSEPDRQLLKKLTGTPHLAAINKQDLESRMAAPTGLTSVPVSAYSGSGIERLLQALLTQVHDPQAPPLAHAFLVNLRQSDAISRAAAALSRALDGLQQGEFAELVATELHEALAALGELSGATTTDDLLDRIFSKFCIGK